MIQNIYLTVSFILIHGYEEKNNLPEKDVWN